MDVKTEETPITGKTKIRPCPNCGVKQAIRNPLEDIFPYEYCNSCKKGFFINKDSTVRRMTSEETREIPQSWVQIVEDLSKKKIPIVFRLE